MLVCRGQLGLEMSPSKRLRTWVIHIPELTIIRLKLFSNANCSSDWNSHSMLCGSGFQCKVATVFPLRCANAQCQQNTCVMKPHSRALATVQI